MLDFKKEIANAIAKIVELNSDELYLFIEVPKDSRNGNYSFPCFKLAKVLGKSPIIIAKEIKEKMQLNNDIIEKVDVVSGYINFFVNKSKLAEVVIKEMQENAEYGKSKLGEGTNVLVEYSSLNIAKPFHIGHLRTTLIWSALYNVYKYLGYNTVGINHLGDYGTQFGKMIEAYKLWGSEYDLEEDAINKMMNMYVRINDLCKKDEKVLEQCRENFRLLEEGDSYCSELWKKFSDLSMVEFNKIYDILNVKFDSLKGEAFYADKTNEVVEILEKKEKLLNQKELK